MDDFSDQVKGAKSLVELCDLLNSYTEGVDGLPLEDAVTLTDLPTFGGDYAGEDHIFSYDEKSNLVGGDGGDWAIEPRIETVKMRVI